MQQNAKIEKIETKNYKKDTYTKYAKNVKNQKYQKCEGKNYEQNMQH